MVSLLNISMIKKTVFVFLLSVFIPSAVFAAGWYTDANDKTLVWRFRQPITINHASVDATLTDFPVLVKISGTTNPLFTKALTTGRDIVFTNSDGMTKVSHEVESYDSVAGNLVAWVRIPSLSNTVDTPIYMYYGCTTATTQETKYGTWDSSFVMVMHMKETSGLHRDSTSVSNDALSLIVSQEGAQIGAADGADRFYVNIPGISNEVVSVETKSMSTSAGTISLLASEDASHGATRSYMYFTRSTATTGRLMLFDLYGTLEAGVSATSAVVTTFLIPVKTWHYYTLSWSGTNYVVYADGASVNSGTMTALPSIASYASIGNDGFAPAYEGWAGIIDEVRVSSSQRAATWISTESHTLLSPSTFYSLGAEQNRPQVILISGKRPKNHKKIPA
jgi:hypothetical protein